MLTRFKKAIAGIAIAALSLVGVGITTAPAAANSASFTVTNDATSQPLTVITGTAGTPINETYTIAFPAEQGWIFGQPGFGYGWSPSSRPDSGIEYNFQLNGAPGETQTFTFTVSGTPTQGYYRDQWFELSDDNGLNYRYEFDLAISGDGVDLISTMPNEFAYGDVALSNKPDLLNGVPALYVINPSDNSRVLLQPEAGTNWTKLATENNNVTTFTYATGDLYTDATYGRIRASVSITLTNSAYSYSVDTFSWDWEGEPIAATVELDVPLAAGSQYDSSSTTNNGLAVLSTDLSDAFGVIRVPSATPTFRQESGVVTVVDVAKTNSTFTIEYFDYTGCPTLNEMVSAYDASTLPTTGYESATECPAPAIPSDPIDLAGQSLRFDLATETLNGQSPVNRDQRVGEDDIANGVAVGDTVDYQDVVTVNGVTLNALLTMTAAVGQYSGISGDGLVEEIDDWTGNSELNPRIRTSLEHEGGDSDRYAEYTIVFYVSGDANKTPVTVQNALLNVYDIDGNQYVEVNNMESYVFAQAGALAAQDRGNGFFRFVDVQGIDSDSGDESRVAINFVDTSSLVIRLGLSSLNTNEEGASYALDFSAGAEWTMPTQEPATEPQEPTPPTNPNVPTFSNDPLKKWYALNWNQQPTLFQVDKVTGTLTAIGTAAEPIPNAGWAGLEVDSTNGLGYSMTYGSGIESELWGINLNTGAFNKLATLTGIRDVTAMNLTSDGKMWFAADYYTAPGSETTTPIFGWVNMDTFAVTLLSESMNGERIAALVSDDNNVLYGIGYNGIMYAYNTAENTWTESLNLGRSIYAADYEGGYILAQGWGGDVVAIEIATLNVTTLFNQFTPPSGMSWNGGEAFAVGGVAPVLVINQPEPTPTPTPTPNPEPAPNPQPGPTMQVDPISIPKPVPGVTETEGFKPGAEVEVGGKRLGGLTEVMVGDRKVEFRENTDGGFTVILPADIQPGTYDLVLSGPYGKLTYQSAIKIAALAVVVVPENPGEETPELGKASKSFSGFAPGSAVLTNKMKAEIKAWFTKFNNVTRVDISGFTMGPTVLDRDSKLALRRATVVKAYIKSLDSSIKFSKLTWKNETKLGNPVRRAVVTVNYTK